MLETSGYSKLILSSPCAGEDCLESDAEASLIFLNSCNSSSTNSCSTEMSGHILRFPASSKLSTGTQTSSREDALEERLEDGFDEP
ncbi:hypothetical protein OGATHE_003462 [Ogataea polymorpha]|uniref:Uncharacterized protein n=1 Tax=Ogataea polymorpha TaxID=460523 RepID=A0A9P8P4D3_9ASCO|nr:hypothetical protein OGATHE_003462 [Ogataea polymorpha]